MATAAFAVLLAMGGAQADPIFSDNFNDYAGNQNTNQADTGLPVAYDGTLPGWTAAGGNAVHGVQVGSGNWAVMIWDGPDAASVNSITLQNGVAANAAGKLYTVSFDAAAAVYAIENQATTSSDALNILVIDSSNTVIDTFLYQPGAWNGSETFSDASFNYTGNGNGNVTYEITGAIPGSATFSGAVDNFTVNTPEPASFFLLAAGLAGTALARRRKKAH
ncbi:MAG TPA: PEP-CTERM sorting domain-containing protein [Alphaproteobacteria bacterium]|nr:PEP-CTERM sorting domain-containing protein [Alphaproteobacteria bacterium]